MTYGDIYKEFCKKFPNVEAEDYRPAVEMYIPQLSRSIPNAIIVWIKDGSKVIYMAESEDKEWGTNTNQRRKQNNEEHANGFKQLSL